MSDHPIQGLMTTAMENLKEMVDVNTIIGDPVETPDGSVIITVSKVGFGFAAGGSEFMMDASKKIAIMVNPRVILLVEVAVEVFLSHQSHFLSLTLMK